MPFYTFIISWILAILAMTGFSALISYLSKYEFREHILLSQLMNTIKKASPSTKPKIYLGWSVHFAFGLLFMAFYELLWVLTDFNRTVFWGIIFGLLMGLIGMTGWMLMFRLHPNPPQLHFKIYYFQLVIAHVVFSLTALMGYYFL